MRENLTMSIKRAIIACTPPVVLSLAYKVRSILHVISTSKDYATKSYYPEAEKKSHLKIFWELIVTSWKWGNVTGSYFSFGLDRRDRKLRDYVFLKEFGKVKDALNSYYYDYTTVLNNKILTNTIFRSWNLPVPASLGIIDNRDGLLYLVASDHVCLLKDYINANDINCFCKPLTGVGGHGIFYIKVKNGHIVVDSTEISLEDLGNSITTPMMLEEAIYQHEALSALHPQSVNTIRIITIMVEKNAVQVLAAFQRIGCGGARVDNTHSGGIKVHISQDGLLTGNGYRLSGFGSTMSKHPDTQIVFDKYRIPFFQESLELVKRAHSFIGGIHSVGWDIAITPKGPIIIEANGDWYVEGPQVFYGMRKEFETLFVKRYKELNVRV